jgi:hypothetical protein
MPRQWSTPRSRLTSQVIMLTTGRKRLNEVSETDRNAKFLLTLHYKNGHQGSNPGGHRFVD